MSRAKNSHLMTITREVGIKREELNAQQPVTSVDLYPALEMKPPPVDVESVALQIAFERGYVSRLRQMPYYRRLDAQDLHKICNDRFLPFHRFPKELHPKAKLCLPANRSHLKEIPKKIKAMEERERRKRKDNDEERAGEDERPPPEKRATVEELAPGVEGEAERGGISDQELDEVDLEEDNDYMDSYFDNGEAYLDEEAAESSSDEGTNVLI